MLDRPQNEASPFDLMSKALAGGISRRRALKVAGAGLVGTALASLGVNLALAADDDVADEGNPNLGRCANPLACDCASECDGGANCAGTCYCVPKVRRGNVLNKGFCHDGIACPDTTCRGSAQCRRALGDNWRCAATCCAIGPVCVPACGTIAAVTRISGASLSIPS